MPSAGRAAGTRASVSRLRVAKNPRPDIADDDAASRQGCVVVNSAIVDRAEMEERVFGWGVIGMEDYDGGQARRIVA